jgi:hypothetical protein
MVRLRLNKVLAVVVLAILFGVYIHHDYARWGDRGLDVYLRYQTTRYENYMAPGHPRSVSYFATMAVLTLAAAVYELVAAALAKVLPKENL